jgi:electron transport complex protein RnfE
MMGFGLALVLAVLGGVRELLGAGTLFSGIDLVFGVQAKQWVWHMGDYQGFLLAILPPGAFFGLGSLIAIRNILERRAAAKLAKSAMRAS